jgi:hypothetical protein
MRAKFLNLIVSLIALKKKELVDYEPALFTLLFQANF